MTNLVAAFLGGWLLCWLFLRRAHLAAGLPRWHRALFRLWWRWKCGGGRPRIEPELRELIRRISLENPLWGTPRIHGELPKLRFRVAQSTVSRYMLRRVGRPAQG